MCNFRKVGLYIMEYKFSDKVNGLKASAIREILKFTADPEVISFAAGNPAPEAFPKERIAEISADLLKNDPILALQYSVTEGYTPLRDFLKGWMTEKGCFHKEFDELIITSGGQQANELSCKVLLNEGDTLLCESPSFIGSLNAFRSYNVNLVGVDMEDDGIDLEKLENALKTEKNVKILYLIPNFQNPTGRTMSLEKRKAVYELACKYDFIILEDDPYGELRYEGEFLPPFKSMDTDGRVIFAGSFSKTMAPALRVGFLVAESSLMKRMVVAKQTEDVHTATLTQEICFRYMTEHDFEGHLKDIRKLYAVKCKRMLDDMEQRFSPAITFNRPQGGLFVTAFLPEGMDAWPFVQEGIARKVACVPGVAFVMDPSVPSNAFRMNFSMPSLEQIDQGTEILGKLTYEWCK